MRTAPTRVKSPDAHPSGPCTRTLAWQRSASVSSCFVFFGSEQLKWPLSEHLLLIVRAPYRVRYDSTLSRSRPHNCQSTRHETHFECCNLHTRGHRYPLTNTLSPLNGSFICPWARTSVPGGSKGGTKFDLTKCVVVHVHTDTLLMTVSCCLQASSSAPFHFHHCRCHFQHHSQLHVLQLSLPSTLL